MTFCTRCLVFIIAFSGLALQPSSAKVILRDDDDPDHQSDLIDLSHLGPDLYGEPDEAVGQLVANFNPDTDLGNVEELGSYIEGDILVDRPDGRNGIANTAQRWPNGIVPFVIAGNFDAKGMQLIEEAINEYHAKTCIRFKPHMGETNYIAFESSSSGCWSSVGMIGGKQSVNLQIPGCTTLVGTIIHEMMHALGFLHEQNREDRDGYVRIRTENVKPGTQTNFDKAKTGSTISYGVEYDYGSIMHYSANAFSVNGKPTIEAKRPGGNRMGQRSGFSSSDLDKLNAMYNCKGTVAVRPSQGGSSSNGSPTRPMRPAKPAGNNRPNNGAHVASAIVNFIGSIFGEEDSNTTSNAIDGKPTTNAQMGQREGFSWHDIEKLNRMYGCGGNKGSGKPIHLRPSSFPGGISPSPTVVTPSGSGTEGSPYLPPAGPMPYNPLYPPPYGPYPYGPSWVVPIAPYPFGYGSP